MSQERLRAFVAIELSDQVREVLARLINALRPLVGPQVRWVDPLGAHLTLKFLGSIHSDQVQAIGKVISALARQFRPFLLESAGLGGFPSLRNPAVLWLGLGGDTQAIISIQKAVEEGLLGLGFPMEDRPFHLHLTLGRIDQRTSPQERGRIGQIFSQANAPSSTSVRVTEISLVRSVLTPQGAKYSSLLRVPLGSQEQ